MFQVKKSSYSRKIHKERKKEKNKSNNEKSNKNISNNSPNLRRDSNNITSSLESNYIKEIQSDSDGFSVRLLLFNFYVSKNTINATIIKYI